MMEADAIFPEEMFYSSLPRRMGSRASRFFEREFEAERDRDRERDLLRRERWWSGLGLAENSAGNKNNNNSSQDRNQARKSTKEPVTFMGELEHWPGEVKIA
jgi:hypothetical protein